MHLRVFLILWLALLHVLLKRTYSQKFSFYKFGVEEGLPQNTIYDIFQDRNNFLWLATDGGGLVKYDGHHFTTLNKRNGLYGNVVRCIAEDKNKRLWIATNQGLQYYYNNKFIQLNLLHKKSVYTTSLLIVNEKLFVTTSGDGVFEVDLKTFKIKQFNTSNSNLLSNYAFDLLNDENGNIWIANYNGGIACISTSGEVKAFDNFNLKGKNCITLSALNGNRILCGTRDNGFFVFDAKKYFKNDFESTSKFYLANSTIWDAKYYNNELYVATQESGVYLLNEDFSIKINFNKENGLPSNQFYKIIIDNENNFWLASNGSGLVKFAGFSFLNFDKTHFNTSMGITSIFKKDNNIFWLGADECVFEISENKKFNYGISKVDVLKNVPGIISAFCRDANGNFYVGSKSKGLYILNNKNYTLNYTTKQGLASDNISSLLYNPNDNSVWVGTDGGISIAKNGELFTISESNGLINNEVQKIDLVNNYVVVATNGGLVIFDKSTMQSFDEAEGLNETRLHTFCANKAGRLYLGTFGDGIYVSDSAVGRIKKFEKLQTAGLDLENIYSLATINDTLLAATCDKGLALLSIKNEKVENAFLFNDKNGFEGIESNLNACLLSNNKLLIGTVTGISIINLDNLSLNFPSPRIFVDSIIVSGNKIENLNGKLSYSLNTIELLISLIGFTNSHQNKVEYMLEGHDSHWNTLSSNLFKEFGSLKIKYSKLHPGKYKLIIKAYSADGTKPNTVNYSFEITPPFWSTWWFRIVVIVIIVFVVYLLVKFREQVLIEKNKLLEQMVADRTKEIVLQKEEIEKKNEELFMQNIEILNQRDEIKTQSQLLSEKNREITDSINYAQRIQNSLLPDIEDLKEILPNLFIIYRPKDIVSGDFYWVQKKFQDNNRSLLNIVAADCTGHGVPGAFMSLIGIEKLKEAMDRYTSPSDILTDLNNALKNTLKQNSQSKAKDGMDLALIQINSNKLIYSGANRPLYFIRKNSNAVEEIKADKVAIGGYTELNYRFTQHELFFEKGDRIYIFSDGYADQFGGEFGKKLMSKKFKELLLESFALPLQEQRFYLIDKFDFWKNSHEQVDDVLVMCYEF